MSTAALAESLTRLLDLGARPVAISFVDGPPAGVPHVAAPQPASCGYWRLAADQGQVFYTEPADHHGCPVGAHTHAAPVPDAVKSELDRLIGMMIDLEYLSAQDIPAIPTRRRPLTCAVYAPLADAPVEPDVVLLRAGMRQMMLLQEAAMSAGVAGQGATLGRPTCAVLPQAENSARTASSFGCVGNRVYTGAADHEAYFAIPGPALGALVARLDVIVRANRELESFHKSRLS